VKSEHVVHCRPPVGEPADAAELGLRAPSSDARMRAASRWWRMNSAPNTRSASYFYGAAGVRKSFCSGELGDRSAFYSRS